MAIERWTDDMLDLLATEAREAREERRELRQALLTLTDAQSQTNRNVDRIISAVQEIGNDIREMQSEIRGLQTENRRILDRLFPEQP